MNPTCQRKARKAEHLVFDGTNDQAIKSFVMPKMASRFNACLIVREQYDGVFCVLHPGDVVLRGEDNKLRHYTADEFELMYEVIE